MLQSYVENYAVLVQFAVDQDYRKMPTSKTIIEAMEIDPDLEIPTLGNLNPLIHVLGFLESVSRMVCNYSSYIVKADLLFRQ
ncbi:hypothetical protein L596_030122 [Steinernema carpocapsae]|uniref:Uncharacterized protein n=1 Tax=Steinernema carpocapsae TaxID=34508 RepID=A0A4U5LRS7_STECR|nr:hypothetical protein L596_030122 [Steinernema carpocapsae]